MLLGALPLAEPFAALDASDARMVDTLDVMEEVGTSASALRELEEGAEAEGAVHRRRLVLELLWRQSP